MSVISSGQSGARRSKTADGHFMENGWLTELFLEDFGGYFLIISGWRVEVSSAFSTNNWTIALEQIQMVISGKLENLLGHFSLFICQPVQNNQRQEQQKTSSRNQDKMFLSSFVFLFFLKHGNATNSCSCFSGDRLWGLQGLHADLPGEWTVPGVLPAPLPFVQQQGTKTQSVILRPAKGSWWVHNHQFSMHQNKKAFSWKTKMLFVKVEQFLLWTTFVTIKQQSMFLCCSIMLHCCLNCHLSTKLPFSSHQLVFQGCNASCGWSANPENSSVSRDLIGSLIHSARHEDTQTTQRQMPGPGIKTTMYLLWGGR